MKKALKFIVFLLVSLLFISGCEFASTPAEEEVYGQLSTPVLTIQDETLTWEDVEHATTYYVYANGELASIGYFNKYDLTKYRNLEVTFKVCAKDKNGKYGDSEFAVKEYYYEYIVNKPTDYSVFMINDTHGAFADGQFSGIDRVGTIVAELEEKENLIKISNGDIFQGSYVSNVLEGRPLIEALNLMEFDAFVVGNHDFDWGLDVLHQYKDGDPSNGEANFPMLGANIYYKATGERVEWLDPYTVVDLNGLKIGIIGLIGYNLESSILAEMVADYDFVYPLQLIKDYASELRNDLGCEAVLVSIHDYDEDLNAEIAKLKGSYAIDGILCGHTHENISETLTRPDGVKIPVVENSDKNKSAISIHFDLEENTFKVTRYTPADYKENSELVLLQSKYQKYIDEGNRVLGTTPYISRQELGGYATDAMKEEFGVDIAIMNTAGVRAYIPSGVTTVSTVYEVFPFNNRIITLSLKGSDIIDLYNNSGSYLYFNTSFNIRNINKNNYYTIAVIDYVFTGVYYDQFRNVDYVDTNIIMRDLLIDYIDDLY